MIRNEDIQFDVFICGVKAERYKTPSGDGFRVRRFPFVLSIYPQYTDPCLNLSISIIGGHEVWNEPHLVNNSNMVQIYQRAVERIEIAAANLIEDLLCIRNCYTQPGPRVIPSANQ